MSHVLLINDEADLVEMCKIVLESAGHRVTATLRAEDVLGLAIASGPNVVLLDLVMPGMDGEAVLRALRQHPETASIPVVVMSALPDLGERAKAMGADFFLSKPFSPNEVQTVVSRAAHASAHR